MSGERPKQTQPEGVTPSLDPMSADVYKQVVENTNGNTVEVTDIRGEKTVGVNLGFLSFDKGITIVSDSVVLDIEAGDEGTKTHILPRKVVNNIKLIGGQVVNFPKS